MLSTKLFYKFFCAVTVVTFMFQLMNPTTVYADGEDATPEPAPTSIPVDEATPAPSELVIPEGTDLIVLDENGQPLPLATQAAADVIVSGDPIWCPDTVDTPTSGLYGCSTNDGTLMTALFFASQQPADGTIWIQATPEDKSYIYNEYVGNTHALTLQGGWGGDPNKIVSDVSTFTVPISIYWGGQLTINNLTIDGSDSDPVIQMLEIYTTAADPSGSASAVTMNNVTVTGSKSGDGGGNGAKITAENGSVEVSGSNFDNNARYGLEITAKNNITLNDVTANNNTNSTGTHAGAILSTDVGKISVTDSEFSNNNSTEYDAYGLQARTNYGDILLENVIAEGNQRGVTLENNSGGDITISNSFFNKNEYWGLEARAGREGCDSEWTCNFTLSGVEANNNNRVGADIWTGVGIISVTDSHFDENEETGLWATTNYGDIIVSNITADNNYDSDSWGGAYFATEHGGSVSVTDSSFSYNGSWGYAGKAGLYVNTGDYGVCETGNICDITLSGITANGNFGEGAEIWAGGNITVSKSSFNENAWDGIILGGNWGYTEDGLPLPTIKLTNVTANGNIYGDGLNFRGPIDEAGYVGDQEYVVNAAANILICSGSYSDNTGYGIAINNFGGSTTFGGTVVSTGNNIDGEVPGENWLNPEAALGGDCVEVSLDGGERTKAKPAQKGYENSSEAVNSQEKTFNCDSYLGLVIYTEELKDEDHVAIPCGSKGTGTRASAFKTMESDLPGKPSVGTFVSALKLAIEDNENAAAIHTGPMMVSFKLPEGANPSDYSLMFWNGTAWELVPNIFSADGYFQSWVNMLGYYMLIKN